MKSSETSQRIFAALGEFTYEFATLENYIRFAIVASIEADSDAAMFLINKMDAKVCLTKLRAILKQRHYLTDDLKHLLDACRAASDFRNELLHLAPAVYDNSTVLRIFPFGTNIQRGQRGTAPRLVPAEQLDLATKFCRDASIDLSCIRRTLKRGEPLSIAGLTKAAFPLGFPNYLTADQALAHSFDLKEYEVAHEKADRLSGDAQG